MVAEVEGCVSTALTGHGLCLAHSDIQENRRLNKGDPIPPLFAVRNLRPGEGRQCAQLKMRQDVSTRVLKLISDRRQGLPAEQNPPLRACTPESAMAPLPCLKGAELQKHKELTSAVPCWKLPNAPQTRNSSF